MPGLNYAVHLSRSAPFDVACGQILFYDVIDSDIMSRSSVLSCVAEGGGEAQLPDSVIVSDFRRWLTAVTDDDAVFRSRSFVSMCSILKVADAVDDKLMDSWVDVAAEKLKRDALSTCSDQMKKDTFDGLSTLSGDLRHRLLAAAAFDPMQLDSLLYFFPTSLHAAVIAAMITREQMIRLPLSSRSFPALKALTSLPASPASVLALRVDNETAEQRGNKEGDMLWSGLKQALRHHTGLTALYLSPSPSSATWSEADLLPQIATLTSLRALDLSGCMILCGSLSTATATLRALTQLVSLKLRLSEDLGTSSQKRQRDEAAPSPHCLSDMLSASTALTSLHIHVCRRVLSGNKGSCEVAAPLCLPKLVHLTAGFQKAIAARSGTVCTFGMDVHLATRFFSHLSAPLTCLTFGKEGLQDPEPIPADTAADAGRLLRSLATFTQLRCLSAVLPTDKYPHSSVCGALTAAMPALVAALHQPLSISIAADSAVVWRTMHLLAATTLTHLQLRRLRGHNKRASEELLQCAGQWKLRELSLHSWAARMAAQSSLSQLTSLHLHGWACFIDSGDWRALESMTCLQSLCFEELNGDDSDGLEHVEADDITSLHKLSSLTSLSVMTSDLDADEVVRGLAVQPLPALQELKLALYEPFDTVHDLSSYIVALPVLKRLLVDLHRFVDVGECEQKSFDSWYYINSEEHPENQALSCLRDAKECLSEAAARAGVELSMAEHGFMPIVSGTS